MTKLGKELIESAREALDIANGGPGSARLAPFDAADYLDSDEAMAEYLAAGLEDGDPAVVANTVQVIMRARGEATAKAPTLASFLAITTALGLAVRVQPLQQEAASKNYQIHLDSDLLLGVAEAARDINWETHIDKINSISDILELKLYSASIVRQFEDISRLIARFEVRACSENDGSGGGKRSGEARRAKAAATWHSHATDLALAFREKNKKLSNDGMAAKILEAWSTDKGKPPSHRTVMGYVARLIREGKLAARSN